MSIRIYNSIDSIDSMKYEKNYVQPNFNSAERVYILIDSQ